MHQAFNYLKSFCINIQCLDYVWVKQTRVETRVCVAVKVKEWSYVFAQDHVCGFLGVAASQVLSIPAR